MNRCLAHPALNARRGLAVLPVISLLLIGLSVLTLLSSRAQWAEWRSSAGLVRARIAFEAAEAGLIHATLALSEPSAAPTAGAPSGCSASAPPRCVAERAPATGWLCQCGLTATLPEPTLSNTEVDRPAFATRVEALAEPGRVEIISTGCSSVAKGCGGQRTPDASVSLRAVLATIGAPWTVPDATLSAQGEVRLRGGTQVVHHSADPASLTVDAGQAISIDASAGLQGAPGTPPESTRIEFDPAWAQTRFEDHVRRLFGMPANQLARLPQWLKPPCAPACTVAGLSALQAATTGQARMIWIEGDLHLSTPGPASLGTGERPVLLIVTGRLVLDGPISLVGWVIAGQALSWQSAPAGTLRGAAQVLGDVSIDGALSLGFDRPVLQALVSDTGTRVSVPGSWRDHTP